MAEKESEEDSSELIYDLPEFFMMKWEELMGMTSTVGYDIWSEDAIETPIKLPSIHKWGETLQTLIKLPNTHIWGEGTSNPNQTT